MVDDQGPNKVVGVFLKPKYIEILDAKGRELQLTRSALIRWIIADWAKKEEEKGGKV